MKITIWFKSGSELKRFRIEDICFHDGMIFLDFGHTSESYHIIDIKEYSINIDNEVK